MKYFSPQFIGLPLFLLKDSPLLTKIVYVGGGEKIFASSFSIHTHEGRFFTVRGGWAVEPQREDTGMKFAEPWRFKSTLNRFSIPVYA